MAYKIKNKVKCKEDCRLCRALGHCTPTCGKCMDFKRVERFTPSRSHDETNSFENLREGLDMRTKKFEEQGVGSVGWWLLQLRDCQPASINKLADRTANYFYKAEWVIKALIERGMARQSNPGSERAKYEITAWADAEIKLYLEWKGVDPAAPKLAEVEPATDEQIERARRAAVEGGIEEKHNQTIRPRTQQDYPAPEKAELSTTRNQDLQHVEKPESVTESAKPTLTVTKDAYMDAFYELLVERFGHEISFADVLERLKV